MLSALGYLGKTAYKKDKAAAERAHTFLRQFNPAGGHPSVTRAKLVGLGYLGDWLPLLSALDTEDPILHSAARNTIELWVPGPFTPDGYRDPEQIANWVAGQLARPDPHPTSTRRSTLSSIKEELQSRLGRYVVD
jgi:hypothetical protein